MSYTFYFHRNLLHTIEFTQDFQGLGGSLIKEEGNLPVTGTRGRRDFQLIPSQVSGEMFGDRWVT